jgi:hypothetical protein
MITLDPSSLLNVGSTSPRASRVGDLPESFSIPFTRLAESLDREAELTLVGRRVMQNQLVRLVGQRRRLEETHDGRWAREPRVVVVVGLPRTGTTFLHRLLAERTDADWVPLWEALEPFGDSIDARRAAAARYLAVVDRLSPRLGTLHPMGVDLAEECDVALQLTGLSDWYTIAHRCRAYREWLESEPRRESYATYRRLLVCIRPHGRALLLKSPSHLPHLGALFGTFPNCRVVWLHRPLSAVVPSMVRLVHAARSVTCDPGSFEEIEHEWRPRLRRRIDRGSPFRDDPRVLNLEFDDLVRDPDRTAARISEFADLRPRAKPPPGPCHGTVVQEGDER